MNNKKNVPPKFIWIIAFSSKPEDISFLIDKFHIELCV